MNSKFILFFVESLFAFKVNLIGQISIGEIITLLFLLFHFDKSNSKLIIQTKILNSYFFIFFAQILSELFVSNGIFDSLRGLMVTVVSFSHFYFLLYYGKKNNSNIIYAFLGFCTAVVFGIGEEVPIANEIIEGKAVAFVKFKLVNIVGITLVFFSLYLKKLHIIILSFFCGVIMILLGARNGGSTIVLSGVFTLCYFLKKRYIHPKRIFPFAFVFICLLYGLYFIYVNNVLLGNINSGNNHQILSLNNPYNPIELIIRGRGEFFVGIQAFFDEFLFGHGAWAKDVTGKYWQLLSELNDIDTNFIGVWLPVHSVLIGWGAYNGIFTFIAGFILFIQILKLSYNIFISNFLHSRFVFCFSYSVLAFIWNILFSPPSHFRLSLPLFMAAIIVIYNTCLQKKT